MALTISNAGVITSTATVSSVTITSVTAAVGDMLVVDIANSNAGTNGASSISGVEDSASNTWTQRILNNNDPGAANAGSTLGGYTATVTTALSGGTITVNLSPSTPQTAVVSYRIQPGSGNQVTYVTAGSGATGTSSTPSVTSGSITSGHTIIGMVAAEHSVAPTGDADTSNGSWSTIYTGVADGGAGANYQCVGMQYKTVTGTATQTYNPTLSASRDWAINYLVVKETVADALTGNNIASSAPVISSPALTQKHVLTGNNVTSGTPVASSPSLTQVHALTGNNVQSGTPVISSPALSLSYTLTGNSVTSGTPVISSPAISQTHSLTGSNILSGTPVVSSPALSQVHALTGNNLGSGVPVITSPALSQSHTLSGNNVLSGVPVITSPELTIGSGSDDLTGNSITSSVPVIGSPALTQVHTLTGTNVLSGTPVISSPAIEAHPYSVSVACQASSTTSETSWNIGPIDASVGDNLLIFVSSDNEGAGGTSPIGSITDTGANTYTLMAGRTSTYGVPGDGGTIESRKSIITTALTGGTISIAFDVATVHKVATVYRIHGGTELTALVAHKSATVGEPVTSVGPASINSGLTLFGAICFESDASVTIDSDTTNGTWSADYGGLSDTGGPDDAIRIATQFKRVTATGNQTYNANTGDGRGQAGLTATAYAAFVTTGNSITSGTPVIESPALTQTHALTGNSIASGVAVIESPALSQVHGLTGNSVTSGVPVITSPELTIGVNTDNLTGDSVVSGVPVIGSPAISQTHVLTGSSILGGTPVITAPAISQTHVLTANSVASGTPIISSPVLSQSYTLTGNSVLSGMPVIGSPALSQVHTLTGYNVKSGIPLVSSPSFGQNHVLSGNGILSGVPIIRPTELRTICVDRMSVYSPGMRTRDMYSPGTRSGDMYSPGSLSDTIYTPGGTYDMYVPGSAATQVGCD